jgi:Xaa-Pro dipeptidase
MTDSRISRLRAQMAANGVDAVVVVPSANLYYLTGVRMHLSERVTLAVFTQDGAHLIVPALEVPRVESRAKVALTLHAWSDGEWVQAGWDALKKVFKLDGANVALDYYTVRALELSQLQTFAPTAKFSDASPLFTELRIARCR